MRSNGWHRALDIQMDTHKWCLDQYGAVYNIGLFESLLGREDAEDIGVDSFPEGDKTAVQLAAHLAITLWRADTIYVTSDMLHLMLQAAHDLPDDVCFDRHTLISPRGFCLFEEPLAGEDRKGKHMLIHAIAWELNRFTGAEQTEPQEGIIIWFLVDPTDLGDDYNAEYLEIHRRDGIPIPPLVANHLYPALDGQRVPQVTIPGSELVVAVCRLFIAMQLLAQQKIGEPVQMRPDRATRRRLARNFPDMPERVISLITLRRKSVKKEGEPEKVEWSRRWPVRGHWRRQYYPKTKTHDWVYIHEYIKGPEDKPLVFTERRVFNFRR